jgi:hypothetical protein
MRDDAKRCAEQLLHGDASDARGGDIATEEAARCESTSRSTAPRVGDRRVDGFFEVLDQEWLS